MAKKITFEETLIQLEDIVDRLENSDISLDEAVKLYEKGIKLSVTCEKILGEAKQKILILSAGENGTKEVEIDYDKL